MSLDILIGPMFAGKSSTILSLVSRHTAIGTQVLVIKHESDKRYPYSENNIVTHDGRRALCVSTHDLSTTFDRASDFQVVIVDEAQFFEGLVAFVRTMVDEMGKTLYLVGLDGDFHRKPFGEILNCIPLADRVQKLTAFCHRCADRTPGIFSSRRKGSPDQQVIVGGSELYETLCRACYLHQNPSSA